MTRRPRLVATDLDGTLLGADGRVSDRTRSVLVALEEEHDVPVVFVTGRPVRWMDDLWVDVGGHGLAICSNGGIVFDVAAREVREAFPITPATLLDVAERVRAALPGTMFALETLTGFAHEPAWTPRPGGGRPHRGPEPVVAPSRSSWRTTPPPASSSSPVTTRPTPRPTGARSTTSWATSPR
ncbi:HAD family hydrolase [Nocardioides zeae]